MSSGYAQDQGVSSVMENDRVLLGSVHVVSVFLSLSALPSLSCPVNCAPCKIIVQLLLQESGHGKASIHLSSGSYDLVSSIYGMHEMASVRCLASVSTRTSSRSTSFWLQQPTSSAGCLSAEFVPCFGLSVRRLPQSPRALARGAADRSPRICKRSPPPTPSLPA